VLVGRARTAAANFPTDYDLGLLLVPPEMGVLKPSRNVLYLLSNTTRPHGTPIVATSAVVDSSAAFNAQLDHVLWHRRCGHINMQSFEA
jgi:hypothetical protein